MSCAPSPVSGSSSNNAPRSNGGDNLPKDPESIKKAVENLPPDQRQSFIDKLKEEGVKVPYDIESMATNEGDIN